ncbi:hypothetical protein V8E54_013499 [Elaphomyces granulatus]
MADWLQPLPSINCNPHYTRAQAAGIQKRNTAKKTKQAPKAAKKGGRKRRGATQASAISPRENDNEAEEEELEEEEPFTIDDEDDIDPLAGVTDPLQRMQIKALMAEEKRKMAEEKRKQELHDLDVRQREAQMTGTAGPSTSAAIVPVDDLGESLLSPVERQQVLSFPTIPKKHVIAIARNTFDPGNLPYLESLTLDDHTPDVTISFEDGKLKQSKSVGKASAIKSPAIWTKNFITYVRIVSIFHGVQHPKIVDKLLEFHNTIMELSHTYDWQKAQRQLTQFKRDYPQLCDITGILRNDDKDAEGTTIKFLGRMVDSTTFTVSIPKDKVDRVISLTADALASDSMTIHEAQQLAGLLSFCATAVQLGFVFCRRIWSFVASFKSEWKKDFKRRIPAPVREDVQWWHDLFPVFNGVRFFDDTNRGIIHLVQGMGAFYFDDVDSPTCDWKEHATHLPPEHALALPLPNRDPYEPFSKSQLSCVPSSELGFARSALEKSAIHPISWSRQEEYKSYQRFYEDYCYGEGFQNPYPATPEKLVEWVALRAEGSIEQGQSRIKAESILQGLSAIRAVHVARSTPGTREEREDQSRTSFEEATRANHVSGSSDDDSEADSDEPPSCNLSNPEVNNLNFDTAIKLAFAGFLRTAELTCEAKDLENKPVFEHTKLQRRDNDAISPSQTTTSMLCFYSVRANQIMTIQASKS